MAGPGEAERLKALEARIAAARLANAQTAPTKAEDHHSQAQLAWRMVIELVAGLGIGFGIGYGLDLVLGSTPWLMMVFTILGFIAGIKTMIRSAEEVGRKQGLASEATNSSVDAATVDKDGEDKANGDERRGKPE